MEENYSFYIDDNPRNHLVLTKQIKITEDSNFFKAMIYFEDGCKMENVRAYAIIHKLKNVSQVIRYQPEDIIGKVDSIDKIKEDGFMIYFKTNYSYKRIYKFIKKIKYIKELELLHLEDAE